MNLEQLQYIIEVAKSKSLLAAAKNLHVTQSALSQSITNLETELGITLFNRSRMGTIPTPEGKRIIKKALSIESMLQEIKDDAKQHRIISGGKLRIAAIPGVMSSLVKTVSSLKKDYPDVHFIMLEKGSEEIMTQIRQNKVDIGLISIKPDMGEQEIGLHFDPFWKGKIVVGVWKHSPLAAKKTVTPEELLKHSFVLYDEENLHEYIDQFTKEIGPLHILFSSNNVVAIANALKEELAISIGYNFTFIDNPHVQSGDLVMIEIERLEQKSISLGWVRSENTKASLLSKHFINRFLYEMQAGSL